MNECVTETGLASVDRLLAQAFEALEAVAAGGGDADLLAVLCRCEGVVRRRTG